MALILASTSPRRKTILSQLGIDYVAEDPFVDESLDQIPVIEAPRLLAERKALAISLKKPEDLVVGYDTLVFCDQHPLGKPGSAEEARIMLEMLRNRWHEVISGFAFARKGRILHSGQETTRVRFRPFTKSELDDYIAGGEPFDKAGAYGIQGQGARFVQAIEGCYYNVVGLPVARTLEVLNILSEN